MLKLKQFSPTIFIQKRWKNKKTHWAVLNKKKYPINRALESFDDFYGSVYGDGWKSIRIALLSKHKYVAMVNMFGDAKDTCINLEKYGAINIKTLVDLAQKGSEDENFENYNESNSKVKNIIKGFIKEKEHSEITSIYPPNTFDNDLTAKTLSTSEMTDSLIKISEQTKILDSKEKIINYKKSLEQSSNEDMEIDQSRLVNIKQGTGGLYEYIPANNIKGMEDWIPESDHYKYYSLNNDFPINFYKENNFTFPNHLDLYTYEKGNCSTFIPPTKSITGVHSHFLMDGASILPPLLLNIKKGDVVLDACAAPGGKSLLMLQTLYPAFLVCNDIQENRLKRVQNIMRQYIIDFDEKWDNKYCSLTKSDASVIDDYEKYDKILVDVPCTTDRHSLMENDNNIFKPTRIKERLKLPEKQSAILSNCIRLLKPGGSLIYSTCSLSPIQNDGVVHMALQKMFTDFGITATIIDLSSIIQLFNDIFKFDYSNNMKYGQLVLPYLPANFGPMYICKIKRN